MLRGWFRLGGRLQSSYRDVPVWLEIDLGSSATVEFAEQVRYVRETLAEISGDPSGFRIAERVYIAVDDNPVQAEQPARRMSGAVTPSRRRRESRSDGERLRAGGETVVSAVRGPRRVRSRGGR